MGKLIELPPFVHDAHVAHEGDGDDNMAAEALRELLDVGIASALEPVAPSAALLARLTETLSHPPQRYAPFYRGLATLFDLSEDAVIAQLTRLKEPTVWKFAGLAGIHNVKVRAGPQVRAAETLFVRFAPGTRFPRHRHLGMERTLVLEGNYTDSAGVVHLPGELRQWTAGTEHSFVVGQQEPCIFASVTFGRRFHARPLRLLARILGRH